MRVDSDLDPRRLNGNADAGVRPRFICGSGHYPRLLKEATVTTIEVPKGLVTSVMTSVMPLVMTSGMTSGMTSAMTSGMTSGNPATECHDFS